MNEEIIKQMVEVRLPDEESFLKVRETLTRIGIASRKDKKLYQSCHILHKQGHYFLCHFKQLFALDGKTSNYSKEDEARLNTIVNLLTEWDLVSPLRTPDPGAPVAPLNQIKILPHKEKGEWELVAKYSIGRVKRASAAA